MRHSFWTRRELVGYGVLGSAHLLFLAGRQVPGQRRQADTDRALLTAAARKSIRRGLDFLTGRQNQEGSFGSEGFARNTAVCSLAGLAMLAHGSTPGRGPFGVAVDRLLGFVLSQSSDSGLIAVEDPVARGPMYGHGFATLFLSQVYGMSRRPKVRENLKRAVQLIIDTQNEQGGWRYEPRRGDADISVTICQMTALRAARDVGIHVPAKTVQQCMAYVKRAQNADGGFMYTHEGGESGFPRTAAAVVAFYNAGIYKGRELESALEYMRRFAPDEQMTPPPQYFLYGQYYAAQAWWYTGGDAWRRWYTPVREALLASQASDGSWSDRVGPEYATALCCLILQMPNNFLPILQR